MRYKKAHPAICHRCRKEITKDMEICRTLQKWFCSENCAKKFLHEDNERMKLSIEKNNKGKDIREVIQ